MSAFKGTPGPWEVCNGSDVFTLLGARNASGAVAAENDGWHIADCDMGPSSTGEGEADIPHAEKRANARLIAAAPELLEACQSALAFVAAWAGVYQQDHGLPDFHPKHQEAIDQVKSAIAKATGGAA